MAIGIHTASDRLSSLKYGTLITPEIDEWIQGVLADNQEYYNTAALMERGWW